jgi:hypothetical protein
MKKNTASQKMVTQKTGLRTGSETIGAPIQRNDQESTCGLLYIKVK